MIRKLIACASLTLAVLAAGAEGARAQPVLTASQDPAVGARLFHDKGCVRCHAVNGRGGTVGPDLARARRSRTLYDLAAGLWNHAPKMAARMRERDIPRPPLTSIQPDTERLGYEAAEVLDQMIKGKRPKIEMVQIPPMRVVERTSTDV